MKRTRTRTRIVVAGLLASMSAILAIVVLRAIALGVLGVDPQFRPIASPQPLIATTLAGVGATIVLALLMRRAERPIDAFVRISTIVFHASLVPPLALLVVDGGYVGTTVTAVVSLLIMHVAAAGTIVGVTLGIVTQDSPFHTHEAGVVHA